MSEARPVQYPNHSGPRVWFITDSTSPIGVEVIRHLLQHGDSIAAGAFPTDLDPTKSERGIELLNFLDEISQDEKLKQRFRLIKFDLTLKNECQWAVAEAIEAFGRVDILLCNTSEALIGTVEELGQSQAAQNAVQHQFEVNFLGPVCLIKTLLPHLRTQHHGHIVLLTAITAHLGTPGLPIYCASHWALEGYTDSLAYEIAPFNIRVSIVQCSIEISILTNKIAAVPAMQAYRTPKPNPAPIARGLLARIVDQVETPVLRARTNRDSSPGSATLLSPTDHSQQSFTQLIDPAMPVSLFPRLPASFQQQLCQETVHALLAIGGHENPPARHIVGHEGVASVKEKLRTLSEELEEFVGTSIAVDY